MHTMRRKMGRGNLRRTLKGVPFVKVGATMKCETEEKIVQCNTCNTTPVLHVDSSQQGTNNQNTQGLLAIQGEQAFLQLTMNEAFNHDQQADVITTRMVPVTWTFYPRESSMAWLPEPGMK